MNERIYKATCQMIFLLSISRSAFVVGIIGLVTPNLWDLILIVIGVLSHLSVYPYTGFRLYNFRVIEKASDFKPLKKWMVPSGNQELSGHDYEEFLKHDLSPLGLDKLQQLKTKGSITIYDQMNMYLFEELVGQPEKYKTDDKNLKSSIKSGF